MNPWGCWWGEVKASDLCLASSLDVGENLVFALGSGEGVNLMMYPSAALATTDPEPPT
jgi:hypothetical protein